MADRAPFRVTRLHHPSHHVTDLGEAEAWFERVSASPSRPMADDPRRAIGMAGQLGEAAHADLLRGARRRRALRYESLPQIPFPRDRAVLARHRADRPPRPCPAGGGRHARQHGRLHRTERGARRDSTFVHLADAVFEYPAPDEGTHPRTGPTPGRTTPAERHLRAQVVGIRARSAEAITTDPDTSLGVPRGSTTGLTPGDPRQAG